MQPLKRAAFLAHSSSSSYQKKLARTQQVCREFVECCDSPTVSLSFGKDSIVMGDIFVKLEPAIIGFHCDRGEGGDIQEIKDVKAALVQRWGMELHTIQTEYSALHCYKNDMPIRKYLIEACDAFLCDIGAGGSAIGITKDESTPRRKAIQKNGLLFQMVSCMWRCYPIGYWTARDIWAYIVSNDLPYPPIYDALEQSGVAYESPFSRTSNIIGGTAAHFGRYQRSAAASQEMRDFYRANEVEY